MWTIHCVENTIKISDAVAKKVFEASGEGEGDDFYSEHFERLEEVAYQGKLSFNPDHFEHMDFLSNPDIQEALKKAKVKGQVCFVDNEGDGRGSAWGYRFDGKGGMEELIGEYVWKVTK